MDFFGLLSMIGGLALFLYGMDTMGQGLESCPAAAWSGSWKSSHPTPLRQYFWAPALRL